MAFLRWLPHTFVVLFRLETGGWYVFRDRPLWYVVDMASLEDPEGVEYNLQQLAQDELDLRLLAMKRHFEKAASQLESVMDLVPVSDMGEGQENECPICGAEPGHPCTGPDPDEPLSGLWVEYGRKVHRERQK